MNPATSAIIGRFAIEGEVVAVEPLHLGHINDSTRVTVQSGGDARVFLLQRLNRRVFARPDHVMENIGRVTTHLAQKMRSNRRDDDRRRALTLVPTKSGDGYTVDDEGDCWRLYPFIEGADFYSAVTTPRQAYAGGFAFGEFQGLLVDLDGPRLHETIPDFHHTPRRYEALDDAISQDAFDRARQAQAQIDGAMAHRDWAGVLLDLHEAGEIPERVVHNDAKISNVLLDRATGEAICVVDLDTVMPGLALHDFGDMVRSMTCRAGEDERDLSAVAVDLELLSSLARGYLAAASDFLTGAERAHLVTAGKLITLEQAVRFLTDHLRGDVYYKTTRADQNLDRCRVQLRLLASIVEREGEMEEGIPR